MKHYVLGIVFNDQLDTVLVIHKQRPEWQRGKINFPGGKVEPGEFPTAAVVREIQEETNLSTLATEWKHIGVIQNRDEDYAVEIFTCIYDIKLHGMIRTMTDEHVQFMAVENVPKNNATISNLSWLVYFAKNIHKQGQHDQLFFGQFNYRNR